MNLRIFVFVWAQHVAEPKDVESGRSSNLCLLGPIAMPKNIGLESELDPCHLGLKFYQA
jgi:hypothetical protein